MLLKSTLNRHRKKNIYLFLSGGFGNQLFQYAYAKNLSIKNKANLIIDSYSGFLFDFKYFRNFSLNIKTKKKNYYFSIFILKNEEWTKAYVSHERKKTGF